MDGVPLAIKDNIDLRGLVTTAGMDTRREARALDDQVAAVPDDGLRAALASLGRAVRGLARRP